MNIKSKLTIFFSILCLIISSNLFADERAPKGKCYLSAGFIDSKSMVKDFVANLGYSPAVYEIFERSDKKLYFTFGKIDEKLFKSLKSQGSIPSSFFCASGKGFLKRFSLDSGLTLIKGNKKFLDSPNDVKIALSPFSSSGNNSNTDSNDALETTMLTKAILSNSPQFIQDHKKELDDLISYLRSIRQNITNDEELFTWKSDDNRTNLISFGWGIYINNSFDGFLTDLNGNIVLNPATEFKVGAFNFKNINHGNAYSKSKNWKIFVDAANQHKLFEEIESNISVKAFEHIKELNADIAAKEARIGATNLTWQTNLTPSNRSDYRPCGSFKNAGSFAYVIGPISCMTQVQVNNGNYSWKPGNWEGDTNFQLIKTYSGIDEIINYIEEVKFSQINTLLERYKDPQKNYTLLTFNNNSSQACFVTSGDDLLNQELPAYLGKSFFESNKDKQTEITTNPAIYPTINELYLEISQLKQKNCGVLALSLDELSQLQRAMPNSWKFSLKNDELTSNLFNIADVEGSSQDLYAGLSPQRIKELESITSYEITPKNAYIFVKLDDAFKTRNISLTKDIFKNYQLASKEVTKKNTVSSMVDSFFVIADKFSLLGINILDSSVRERINLEFKKFSAIKFNSSNNFTNFIELSDARNFVNYDLFNELEILDSIRESGLGIDNDYESLLKFYTDELLVAQTDGNSFMNHLAQLKIKAEQDRAAEEERRKKLAAERAERERKERLERAKNYPMTIYVECLFNGRKMPTWNCLSGRPDTEIKVALANRSYEVTMYELVQSNPNGTWQLDIPNNSTKSCSVRAQLAQDYYTLRVIGKDNITKLTLGDQSCSSKFCVAALRC